MKFSEPQKYPQSPIKPQDIPGKENIPKQPEIYPPGDKPVLPTDPSQQPINARINSNE